MFTSTYEMEILARLRRNELVQNAKTNGYYMTHKIDKRNHRKVLNPANTKPNVLRAVDLHNSVLF